MGDQTRSTEEYGTSYFGVRDPEAAKRDLDRFVGCGLNAVLHTFSERDRRYYQGTMEKIVTESHRRSLTVYMNPWAVGGVFGGEALTEFPARHPGARQQLSDGRRLPAACFNAPEFRDFMLEWIEAAAGTDADVLFWDEPHWLTEDFRDASGPQDAWTCRCPHCQRRYRDSRGETMPEKLTESVRFFRRQSILEFLRMVLRHTTEAGLRNAVCFAPKTSPAHDDSGLKQFAALDGLDVLAATPFWELHGRDPETFVGSWSERITQLADEYGLKSQLWIQGFGFDGAPDASAAVRTAVRTALSYDPNSLFLWGWDGCRVMSSLACGDSDAVWRGFLEALPK